MRFYLLLPLSLFFQLCYSQNSARFFNPKGEVFRVWAGGQCVNAKPQNEVLVENIISDTLRLKLELNSERSPDIVLYLSDKGRHVSGMEFDYIVDFSRAPARISFSGMYRQLRLPDPLVPLKPVIDTSYRINNNLLGHFCELKDGKPVYFNNLPKNKTCTEPMPADYMNYVQRLMQRAQTDDEKFAIAENVCRNNCLSVSQLNALLHYSSYEIERLKLVRIGYSSLADTANRQQLQASFRFQSSVDELNSFFQNAGDLRLKKGGHCLQASDTAAVNAFCARLSVFENDAQRYDVLKKTYQLYCYSLPQAAKVLGYFIHDREKLETAKLLYFYCTDPEKYTDLASVFSYGETAGEFRNFISKQSGK